ncbi:MAG: O-antigen ligase family protein [Nocardioidaceae bacterium]
MSAPTAQAPTAVEHGDVHGDPHRDLGGDLGGDVAAHGDVLDAGGVLTVYLVLLFAFPAPLVVHALGSAGGPATILAFAGAFLWGWFRLAREPSAGHRQPVKTAALLFALVVVVVYAHGMTRAVPAFEISPADSAMLRVFALVGIMLLAHDGLPTRERLHVLLRRVATGVGLLAFLALLQFVSGQLWVDRINVPGLVWNLTVQPEISGRNGLTRASGTATSPIELGVVLAMTLPLMITVTIHSEGRRRVLYGAMTAASSFALFLTVSRSALITAVVAIAFMLPAWSRPVRRRVLGLGVVLLGVVYVTVPGLLATFEALFLGVQNDPSARSRTGSFAYAGEFIARSPWLGRGVGTFLPDYHIFDNEYLLLMVEAGVVGVLAWLAMIGVCLLAARRARLLGGTALDREAAQAVGAAVAAGAVGGLFFDLFGFPIVTGLLFVAMGLCGAFLKLARQEADRPAAPVGREAGS